MANFEQAINTILVNEGGYTNDANDRGGKTNFGITEAELVSAVTNGIVQGGTTAETITKDQAMTIYKAHYWNALKLDNISTQSVATKVFDTCVNLGNHWGIVCLQRAIRSATGNALVEDGALGQKTLDAVNTCSSALLLAAYRSEQAGYRRSIVAHDSTQAKFLKGWMNRSYQ